MRGYKNFDSDPHPGDLRHMIEIGYTENQINENGYPEPTDALDQGPGVNRALKAGAVPIEEQMLHNASTDPKIITDALHSSIHTGKVKQKRGGGKQITIGVHHSENGAYYANPVEFVRPDRALMKVA